MYQTIQKYVENESIKNGLLLLDMPTGSGKTYNALQYIYDSVKKGLGKRFFFITTLKKNLPIEDVKKKYKEDNRMQQYEEDVLFINSNFETVLSTFSEKLDNAIPYDVKNTDEYKAFKSHIDGINALGTKTALSDMGLKTSLEDEFRKFVEPTFRKMVEGLLAKQFKKKEDRLNAIKTDTKWRWIGELYPAVYTRERKIIFLSMDKFLARNNTLIEPSYLFYNSDILDDAVVFIDEVDATKDTTLKNVIENGLGDKIDYLELFNKVYFAIQNHVFPADITKPSKRRKESKYKDQSLQDILDKVADIASSIYKDYRLQFSYKTTDDEQNSSNQQFLFQDHQYHSIGKYSWITKYSDYNEKLNRIKFTANKPKLDEDNIHIMLGRLRGFITYFQNAIKILANNYYELRNERRKSDEDEYSVESAVRTILNEFNLDPESTDYLTLQILLSEKRKSLKIKDDDFDLSFYQNGFRYFAFENSPDYDLHSKIMMYSFQVTPEKLFLKVCDKAKVIGISATATVSTNLGNYDVNYIKSILGENYVVVESEDFTRMKNDFSKATIGYKNHINIHTELIGCEEYGLNAWLKVFAGNKDMAEDIFELVGMDCQGATDPRFYQERYLRIAEAYKRFVTTQDIQSFLCVLNFHPKGTYATRNRVLLEKMFDYIATCYDPALTSKNCVRYLDGTDYIEKKEEFLTELETGKKLFVISVYQTIGAGQNLQYKIPNGKQNQLIKVNKWDRNSEKDFDAIYLDRPTNLIVNVNGDNLEADDFIKYIYQMEYLQENYEISTEDTLKRIRAGFTAYRTGKGQFRKNLDTKSIRLLSTKVIIQAVGRICRTNMKNKNIYVFADSRLVDYIDETVLEGRLLNPEFVELVRNMDLKKREIGNEYQELENAANLISARANGYISNILNENYKKGNWSETSMKNWKELRTFVLRYPSMSFEDSVRHVISRNFYIKLPQASNKYTYKEEENYKNVTVSFSNQGNKTVSQDSCYLSALMTQPKIKRHFIENGWATSIEPNEVIMCPTLFNNIYKGVIGEEVGKFLLEEAGCELNEIEDPTLYEKFDYKVEGKDIYIDFKNWHEGTVEELKPELEKIIEKAKQCNCKTVIVANIVVSGNTNYKPREYGDDVKVIIIDNLLKYHDNKLSVNPEAWKKIRKVLGGLND